MLFLAQMVDEALGLSNQLNNLSNLLTTYLPAEQVALLSEAAAKLPGSLTLPSPGMLVVWSLAALLALAVLEQVKFQFGRLGKGHRLPGPSYTVPFLGSMVEMVQDPHAFWERQRDYCTPGLSWNSIVTKYMVMVTDPATIRHCFNHNSKDTLLLDLHPNAKMILGTRNIAFMHGPEHKALRKSFLALFTRRALSMYVEQQDRVIREWLDKWMTAQDAQPGQPMEVRDMVRDMNCATSQRVFIGPYLDDPKVAKKFTDCYMDMVGGFLTFPLKFPGTAVWRAMQGRQYILVVLEEAVLRSKERIRAGAEPSCLLDFWTQQILKECEEAEAANVPPPKYSSTGEMAYTVMDFLFASQDASTASLVWVLTQMADHPDVLQRVRDEQQAARPDLDATITGDTLAAMPYTRQVVKEVLRFRPPAPMVPQVAMKPFNLTPSYTAPKGAFIIPDIISACRQGYTDGDKFDPERFGPERKEDVKFAGNYMVFGHGPHYCVGKEYANNHLITFLAILSTSLDWSRTRTPDSDRIKYLPTIYPWDSIFTFSRRAAAN
uniref:sterol 22-desaturase n=1 Tax=Tetradesmus obliquus TaxID=3088 RepID=A0A383WDD1_TETOB|eukprot:jgi/Sobl393_1/4938/SZX75618.1